MSKEYFSKVTQSNDSFNLHIYIGYKDGRDIYIFRNNEMIKIDPGKPIEPTLSFSYVALAQEPEFLKSLVDGLIAFGIKPSAPTKNNEELLAIKNHLEDMRRLVFKVKVEEI